MRFRLFGSTDEIYDIKNYIDTDPARAAYTAEACIKVCFKSIINLKPSEFVEEIHDYIKIYDLDNTEAHVLFCLINFAFPKLKQYFNNVSMALKKVSSNEKEVLDKYLSNLPNDIILYDYLLNYCINVLNVPNINKSSSSNKKNWDSSRDFSMF